MLLDVPGLATAEVATEEEGWVEVEGGRAEGGVTGAPPR